MDTDGVSKCERSWRITDERNNSVRLQKHVHLALLLQHFTDDNEQEEMNL